eukprot:3601962-Rhodomonas_salina.1
MTTFFRQLYNCRPFLRRSNRTTSTHPALILFPPSRYLSTTKMIPPELGKYANTTRTDSELELSR